MDVFVANDIAAYDNTSAAVEGSVAGRFDPTYTDRYVNGGQQRTAPWINPDTGEEVTLADGWFHASLYHGTTGSAGSSILIMHSVDALELNLYAPSSTTFQWQYHTGAAWVSFGTTFSMAQGLKDFDVHWTITGTGVAIEVYVDNELVHTASATVAGLSAIAKIYFYGGSFTSGTAWSQMLVSDQNTVGAKVPRLNITADGTNTAWNNGYAEVAKTGINDVTYISSEVTDDVETFVMGDVTVPSGYEIDGLWLNVRGRLASTAPTAIKPAVRVGSTNYEGAYELPNLNENAYRGSVAAFKLNPATGSKWAAAAVNGAEIGLKAAA